MGVHYYTGVAVWLLGHCRLSKLKLLVIGCVYLHAEYKEQPVNVSVYIIVVVFLKCLVLGTTPLCHYFVHFNNWPVLCLARVQCIRISLCV